MTEVASLVPADHRLASVRHYQAGPPEGLELVEPGETFATTKEEEWVSKKKTEVTNTKQIETRVKRQVVLEDGKVVEDSGPMVTTNTTEDTETQEHHQTELRKLGDDTPDGKPPALEDSPDGQLAEPVEGKWVAVPNPEGVVREVKEKRVVSREETEEIKETEDIQHLGDITDEDFLAAVRTGKEDIGDLLRTTSSSDGVVVSTGPRLVRDTTRSNKVIDTEDTRELSSVRPDGKIVTETERTTEHEEIKDEELPKDAPIPEDIHKENSQRYLKTREQEDVDYVADGVKIGHEMRFKTETMEVERHGDGFDETDFDVLTGRVRRRSGGNRQPHRYRGLENEATSPLDRKDALTRRPLDFDQEEETRKMETSKWLEHHFGSESRSSNNSVADDEEQPPKTNFFNVTIKSQPSPSRSLTPPQKTYITTVNNTPPPPPPMYSNRTPEPELLERNNRSDSYYKGISQWSERRQQDRHYIAERASPVSPIPQYSPHHQERPSPSPSPSPIQRERLQQRSPILEYSNGHNNRHINSNGRMSPVRDIVTPTPPQRKRTSETRRQHNVIEERSRYDSGYHSHSNSRLANGRVHQQLQQQQQPLEEPPPDYSPPAPQLEKKVVQKTRFAPEPPKQKSGNIIGQSIRKLVGKIRSASAERKAKQRAKRSPSPSYQKGHIIDNNIGNHHNMENGTGRPPVQRYYLGEDPFAGSIYGRENKYDGVRPVRSSRKHQQQSQQQGRPQDEEQHRSQSTLGRFSKSTGRLVNTSVTEQRNSQTLPRHLSRHEPPTRLENSNKPNSQINVSIINTVSRPLKNEGPAKPARTYRSNLARSKSLNVHAADDFNNYNGNRKSGMYTSNPHLHRLDENPVGLKSPGLISSLSRSQKDLVHEENGYTSRFAQRNGTTSDTKKVFLKSLKDRAPELYKTLHEEQPDNSVSSWKTPNSYSTPIKNNNGPHRGYNGDIYEPPTRLRDSHVQAAPQGILRRGSSSSTDYSETYHTTTRSDDPKRPSVTNTVTNITKKTIPSRHGRGMETIESKETKSVTKSHYKGGSGGGDPNVKFYETERRYSGNSPVVIEVRNSNFRK